MAMVTAGGQELLMLTSDDGLSCLHLASESGQLEVVTALVAAGGQTLLMLASDDGYSLYLASANRHSEVARVLVAAGGQELLMLTSDNSPSCRYQAFEIAGNFIRRHLFQWYRSLRVACQELLMLTVDRLAASI